MTDCINMNTGMKFDDNKPAIGFLFKSFPNALTALSRQNDYGAKKYAPMNWKKVAAERYEDALGRHYVEYLNNPTAIDESGESHLAAVIWNACALFELNKIKNEKERR